MEFLTPQASFLLFSQRIQLPRGRDHSPCQIHDTPDRIPLLGVERSVELEQLCFREQSRERVVHLVLYSPDRVRQLRHPAGLAQLVLVHASGSRTHPGQGPRTMTTHRRIRQSG